MKLHTVESTGKFAEWELKEIDSDIFLIPCSRLNWTEKCTVFKILRFERIWDEIRWSNFDLLVPDL